MTEIDDIWCCERKMEVVDVRAVFVVRISNEVKHEYRSIMDWSFDRSWQSVPSFVHVRENSSSFGYHGKSTIQSEYYAYPVRVRRAVVTGEPPTFSVSQSILRVFSELKIGGSWRTRSVHAFDQHSPAKFQSFPRQAESLLWEGHLALCMA